MLGGQYFECVVSTIYRWDMKTVEGLKLNTLARIQSPKGMAAACFDDLLSGGGGCRLVNGRQGRCFLPGGSLLSVFV